MSADARSVIDFRLAGVRWPLTSQAARPQLLGERAGLLVRFLSPGWPIAGLAATIHAESDRG